MNIEMSRMLRNALLGLCALTVLAVVCLTLSVLVLRPPRANLAAWLPLAAMLITQCALTCAVVFRPVAWLRLLVAGGGAGLIVLGLWMVRGTLTSDHFEGYALVLGAMLVLQGALTVAVFLGSRRLLHATS
jgi:hypothetical protein